VFAFRALASRDGIAEVLERAEMFLLFLNPDLRGPAVRSLVPKDARHSGGIQPRHGSVPTVRSSVNFAKVCQPIVAGVSVDVIHLGRPTTMHQSKDGAVSRYRYVKYLAVFPAARI
jgi:hypothetical protein